MALPSPSGARVPSAGPLSALALAAAFGAACRPHAPPAPESASEDPPVPQVVASQGPDADLAATRAFQATRPPYERPLADGLTPPEGLSDLSAATCGACHAEIYAEWQVSTHALAWVDPQYQAEIGKSGNRWLCLNCHTPLLIQQDRWPVGLQGDDVEAPLLVDNARFDAALREEGITCASCHVRDGVIHGPGLADSAAPHPVEADPDFQSNAVCERCHQAVATYPGKGFVCTFDTGSEWAAGPYPAEGTGCVSCHMPTVTRPAGLGGPDRTVARHWWRGAGIPKLADVSPPPEANPPGLGLAAAWTDEGLVLTLQNANAGHRLPTGDPERWVQVDVRFEAAGRPVGESWSTRVGQTWEWWPAPRKLGDNRLAPREERTERVPVPEGADTAVVVASSHRMTPETAAYHELGDYPLSVETHRLTVARP